MLGCLVLLTFEDDEAGEGCLTSSDSLIPPFIDEEEHCMLGGGVTNEIAGIGKSNNYLGEEYVGYMIQEIS
ncbi:hypothetical protein COLO4_06597 [Corchorus olitorius]|uniref:Uncharacterized protein n=1 Tax=Corchorus olitorius TaxID=93759 RepID=A0A1R3KMI3_9ROSI|nr:hypothetical protein COLO4_06597 [Corchorus olitorius]